MYSNIEIIIFKATGTTTITIIMINGRDNRQGYKAGDTL